MAVECLKQVLGSDEWMPRAKPFDLARHEPSVCGVVGRTYGPVVDEVSLAPVDSRSRLIGLPLTFHDRIGCPGRAVDHGCRVGGCCHRAEVAGVLVKIDILSFINFQQE